MLVKCPYCEIESPIEKWSFKLDRIFTIDNGFGKIKGIWNQIFDYARCPICLQEVEIELLGTFINMQTINLEVVKKQIETYHVDIDKKIFYCKNCGYWRNFCDLQLIGRSKAGNEEIVDVNDVFTDNIKLNFFLLEKVKCLCCKTEILIEPFEIKFSLNEDELTKIFNVLNEKTKEVLRQEGRIKWNI